MQPPPHLAGLRTQPELTTALAVWMFSTSGIFFSVFLTILKFRSDYRCDDAALACQGVTGDCSEVFTSPPATLFGIPITIYAASFYLVCWGLSTAAVLHRGVRARVAGVLYSALAASGVLVSIGMALYAAIEFGVVCHYCSVLYLLCLGIAVAVWSPASPRLRDSLPLFVRGWRGLEGASVLLVGLVFLTGVSVQRFLFLEARSEAISNSSVDCQDSSRALPESSLRYRVGERDPEITIGLFVDPACPHCRIKYVELKEIVERSGGCIDLLVYHYPREGDDCGPEDFVEARASLEMRSCQAARAVTCAEEVSDTPGVGLAVLERIFSLAERKESFELNAIQRVVDEAQLGFDPRSEAFTACVKSARARNRIEEQVRFAWHRQISETPIVFIWRRNRVGTGTVERYLGTTADDLLEHALGATSCDETE